MSSGNFARTLEIACSMGQPMLIESAPVEIDPLLEPVLARQIVKSGSAYSIRIGDATVDYDMNFRLFMTTGANIHLFF